MGDLELSAEEVRALVAEARAEARIEAKEILRGRLVDAYLERAAAELRPRREAQAPPAPAPAAAAALDEPQRAREAAPQAEPAAAPQAEPETGDAWYVYCVAEAGVPTGLIGVGGGDVVAVEAAGLVAVTSRVARGEFGEEPLRENLNDLAWLERTARAHQDVLDAAGAAGTIVPLRLCTIYASEDRVRELLAVQRERFAAVLDLLRGKSEWGVKGFADTAALERAALTAAGDVAPGPPGDEADGGAYFERKRREKAARDEALRIADECVHEVHARLEEWAADAVVNRPQNRDLAGYEGEMVLNAAYLIEDERADEFAALVRSFEDRYREIGMRFELTGPWPPYNFVPGGGAAP